ncbi:MAG: histidine phosphatase family protein [Anaerolineae bacterium]|nr:histidine phosphatase family protein [Anaerolineae bacterium]
MTTLYLVRHGETEGNVAHLAQGWDDAPLTARGMRQAESLGARLSTAPFTAAYASPLGRAMHTARIVAAPHGLDVVPCDDLREIHFAEWEGRFWRDIAIEDARRLEIFWKAPHLHTLIDGETFQEVQTRALAALRRIIAVHPGEHVLVVSHTITLKVVLASIEQTPLAAIWEGPRMAHTALTTIEAQNGALRLGLHTDTAHLTGDLLPMDRA